QSCFLTRVVRNEQASSAKWPGSVDDRGRLHGREASGLSGTDYASLEWGRARFGAVTCRCYTLAHRGEAVMTRTISVDEAQDRLQDLLAQALAGNEIIITEHGKPVAR